jgi:iron complex outermembrane recepter protein
MKKIILILALFFTAALTAQENKISGVVTDGSKTPLSGVNVSIKGTSKSTNTAIDGTFLIVAKMGDLLQFSYVGFSKLEATVGNEKNISVTMKPESNSLNEVTVIGTRSRVVRTKIDTPTPVDVISSKELVATGQTEVTQMINFIAPSFNSARQTIANGTDHIDPATLRGLGPDQVLVLVNGKRRYTSALVNVNSTVGRGSVGTDMNAIPSEAIERIEILRDGAAAQYGSDAIAGVVNVVLKKKTGGRFSSQTGQTYQNDGLTNVNSINYGAALGKKNGYINVTAMYSLRNPTDRSGEYNNTVYGGLLPQTRFPGYSWSQSLTPAQIANQNTDNNKVVTNRFDRYGMIVGNSKSENYGGFYNLSIPITEKWNIYSFGGLNQRDGRAAGFYRFPNNTRARNLSMFPDGYLPFIETDIKDKSIAAGIQRSDKEGWNIDFSSVFGGNSIAFDVDNSINASMPGTSSPTHFYAGKLAFDQSTTNINFSKAIPNLGFVKSFNLAFGSEYRIDFYKIRDGQEESWKDYNPAGTAPAAMKGAGVQVFGGFRPSNVIDVNRSNVGFYADIESDITNNFFIGVAGRYENYSDFGSNISGKLSARYKITETFSLRGGINKGFRAPSLHQKYFSSVSTQFITVDGVNQQREVVTVRNDDPITKKLGIPELTAETSLNYSFGGTAKIAKKILLTVDAYQIDLQNRIVVSGRFSSSVPQLAPYFAGTGITEAQFFTNAINTKTKGLDVIVSYNDKIGAQQEISFNAALNLNKTEIVGDVRTPPQLEGLGETLLNREERGRYEVNQPRSKLLLSGNYKINHFSIRLQTARFGEISTIAPVDPTQDQTFTAKWVTDMLIGYQITKNVKFSIGANNLFDVYPDKVADPRLTNDGTVVYSRFASQFGFNGGYSFANVNITF